MMSTSSDIPGLFRFQDQVWFDELDSLGILHHSRYLSHLERAFLDWFGVLLGMERFDPVRYPDLYQVVSRVEVDYLSPIRGPQPIETWIAVERVRAGGLVTRFAIQSPGGGTLFCRGLRAVARMGMETHQPALWTESFRVSLEQWRELAQQFPADVAERLRKG